MEISFQHRGIHRETFTYANGPWGRMVHKIRALIRAQNLSTAQDTALANFTNAVDRDGALQWHQKEMAEWLPAIIQLQKVAEKQGDHHMSNLLAQIVALIGIALDRKVNLRVDWSVEPPRKASPFKYRRNWQR